jgi:hypothetical protein
MGRPRNRANRRGTKGGQDDRANVIVLKGSHEYASWLASLHAATHIPKSTIVRLALADWAKKHGYAAPPDL